MYSPIQNFISQYNELNNLLLNSAEVTRSIEVTEHYRKILLLSCASYYESQIIDTIQEFVNKHSTDQRIFHFLNNKALQRQYHTFFNWKECNNSNINTFLGLFGAEFKNAISEEIKNNENLKSYIIAFLTIGNERNKMVHENYLEYKLDKTFEEIVALHNKAEEFLDYLKGKFV